MSRWKASGIHICISMFLALVVATLLLVVWYPPPYFHAGGADRLVILLIGIDLILGPLLTLVVFRSGKRGMKFDLAIIGVLQLSALCYGVSIICASRPAFLVGAVDRYTLVSANSIEDADLADAKEERFRHLSWTGPMLVAARLPESSDRRMDVAIEAALQGRDIEVRPVYYVDYATEAPNLAKRARDFAKLRKDASAESLALLDEAIKSTGRNEAELGWLPVVGRTSDVVMIIDRATGFPLKPIALSPW